MARENISALSEWMGGASPPRGAARRAWLQSIMARTAAFWDWVGTDLDRADLRPDKNPHGRLGYRVQVSGLQVPFSVHLIGLDSAWLSGDDNDPKRLAATDGQVDMLVCNEGQKLPGFRLALVHHPLTDLVDGRRCRRLLAETVDLLHGHQHEPFAEDTQDPDSSLRIIAAGIKDAFNHGSTVNCQTPCSYQKGLR